MRVRPRFNRPDTVRKDAEQARQRHDVLAVVLDDRRKQLATARSQICEVPLRDQVAGQVVLAGDATKAGLDDRKTRPTKPMLPQLSRHGQQIQMAAHQRWIAAVKPEARRQQRPVEALAVVRDQPAILGQQRLELVQPRTFASVVGHDQLVHTQPPVAPNADADKERQGAGRRGQARRLQVEADERGLSVDEVGKRRQPA